MPAKPQISSFTWPSNPAGSSRSGRSRRNLKDLNSDRLSGTGGGGEIGVDRAARKIAQTGFASDAESEAGGPVRRLEYPKQALVEYQLPRLAGPEHPAHLGGMDKRPPERPEEFRVRQGGLVPEAVELALVGEAFNIVDGAPQHAYRHAVPQARRAHGAVDRNQAARVPHDLRI